MTVFFLLVCLIYSCRGQEEGGKGTGSRVKTAIVHSDSLPGNAERLGPLVVTAGWTSTDITRGGRERQHFVELSERRCNCNLKAKRHWRFLNSAFVFFSVTFEPLTPQRSWRNLKKT